MAETKVTFQSEGLKLAGIVRVPDGVKPGERRPAFIVMHGFGSNTSSQQRARALQDVREARLRHAALRHAAAAARAKASAAI